MKTESGECEVFSRRETIVTVQWERGVTRIIKGERMFLVNTAFHEWRGGGGGGVGGGTDTRVSLGVTLNEDLSIKLKKLFFAYSRHFLALTTKFYATLT